MGPKRNDAELADNNTINYDVFESAETLGSEDLVEESEDTSGTPQSD